MSRALIIINGPKSRQDAHALVDKAPLGTRAEFKASKRTTPQNALMWALLTEISKRPWIDGQKYTPDDLKDYFMHALKRERWMPSEDGGYVPIGRRSSDLTKDEMGDLITLIMEFCARHEIDIERARDAAAATSGADRGPSAEFTTAPRGGTSDVEPRV